MICNYISTCTFCCFGTVFPYQQRLDHNEYGLPTTDLIFKFLFAAIIFFFDLDCFTYYWWPQLFASLAVVGGNYLPLFFGKQEF